MTAPVPGWLQGAWTRRSIRRGAGGALGPPCSRVSVLYVQTPRHFVDVRRPADGGEGVLAFAGVSQVRGARRITNTAVVCADLLR